MVVQLFLQYWGMCWFSGLFLFSEWLITFNLESLFITDFESNDKIKNTMDKRIVSMALMTKDCGIRVALIPEH